MKLGERDPRLAELDLLSYLFRNHQVQVTERGPGEAELSGHGMSNVQWEDMIHHLLVEGLVKTTSYLSPGLDKDRPHKHPDYQTELALNNFHEGRMLAICATHKGRVRLWELMDQFAAARRLEPLGVLLAREGCAPDFEISLARRAPDQVLALLVMDLDHFKAVNDAYGHNGGDEVLRRCFTAIRNSVGRSGNVYRYGGDEVVAVATLAGEDEARTLAELVRKNVEAEFMGKGKLDKLAKQPSASIGLLIVGKRVGFDDAYKAADHLAYKSKSSGRNQVQFDIWR